MKTSLLSAMAGIMLLHKKQRILCCAEVEDSALPWLRRQSFRVESQSADENAARGVLSDIPAYDIAIAEYVENGAAFSDGRRLQLRNTLARLRPGGRLLMIHEKDGLFGDVSREHMRDALSACFDGLKVTGIAPVTCPGHDDVIVMAVKIGGVYTSRTPWRYVDTPDGFARACEHVSASPCLGLDVETTLNEPRILCTVQLATPYIVYVIDALPLTNFTPLKQLLENPEQRKIIHNKSFEEQTLRPYGIAINNVYDTLVESRKRAKKGARQGGHNLGKVCERELGIFLDKSWQTSDWTRRPLSQEQLEYAAADAEVMIRLYHHFEPPPPPQTMDLF